MEPLHMSMDTRNLAKNAVSKFVFIHENVSHVSLNFVNKVSRFRERSRMDRKKLRSHKLADAS